VSLPAYARPIITSRCFLLSSPMALSHSLEHSSPLLHMMASVHACAQLFAGRLDGSLDGRIQAPDYIR